MKTRKIAIILIILLLTIPLTTAKTQANPLAIPTILLPGALGGPIGLAVAGGIAIGTTIIIQYAPTITGIIKTWFKPVIKTKPTTPYPKTPKQYRSQAKHTAYKPKNDIRQISKQKGRIIQQRRDISDKSALKAIKSRGYVLLSKEPRTIKINYYRKQILNYFDKLKLTLKRLGFTETQINNARKYISTQLFSKGRTPDFKIAKNNIVYYLETKTGSSKSRTILGHDLAEVIIDSWLQKYKGIRFIYHFDKVGKFGKLVKLLKILGIPVWVGS